MTQHKAKKPKMTQLSKNVASLKIDYSVPSVCQSKKKVRNFVIIIKTKKLDCWNLLKQYILENLRGVNEKRPKKNRFLGVLIA